MRKGGIRSLVVVLRVMMVVAFFLACVDFRRMFNNLFPACAFVVVVFLFVFKWRLARAN